MDKELKKLKKLEWDRVRLPELAKTGRYGYCVRCGKPKLNAFAKHCSMKCSSATTREKRPEANRVCRQCGKEFRINPAYLTRRHNAGIYCSRQCMNTYQAEHYIKGIDKQGYEVLTVNNKRIRVHRIVMEAMLGRPLLSSEHIHHLNGNKSDNRPDNLRLFSSSEHAKLHSAERWERDSYKLDLDKIREYYKNGLGEKLISRLFGVSPIVIEKRLRDMGIPQTNQRPTKQTFAYFNKLAEEYGVPKWVHYRKRQVSNLPTI